MFSLLGVNLKRLDPFPKLPDLIVNFTQVCLEMLLEDFECLRLRYLDFLDSVVLWGEVFVRQLAEAELDDCVEKAFGRAWLVSGRQRQS